MLNIKWEWDYFISITEKNEKKIPVVTGNYGDFFARIICLSEDSCLQKFGCYIFDDKKPVLALDVYFDYGFMIHNIESYIQTLIDFKDIYKDSDVMRHYFPHIWQ